MSALTDNWQALLIGVNIAGAGTPVASLANLITISQHRKHVQSRSMETQALGTAGFTLIFVLINLMVLALLSAFAVLIIS